MPPWRCIERTRASTTRRNGSVCASWQSIHALLPSARPASTITGTPQRQEQKILLAKHITLAKELSKPLIIHDREAHRDCFDALWAGGAEEVSGVFHAYSGSVEMMHEAVAHGFYIGLGGVVTFKNAKTAKEVAKQVPLDRLLLETDCPYMTPVPFRGRRNEPSYVLTSPKRSLAYARST